MNSITTDLNSPTILIVDDDKTMRILLRHTMEKEGYQVIEATNGEQCLAICASQKLPDLILLDAVMPVMDGFICCNKLQAFINDNANTTESTVDLTQAQILGCNTPVLMITSLEDPESVDRAFEAGATDYVTKPIHWAMLRQRVRRLLQQNQLYKQLEAANQALQHLATIDSLTALANRRRFDEYLNQQWHQLERLQAPLSLILCDIDFFKLYNDTYGHPAGDRCLQQVANIISRSAGRSTDLSARYGGEEFAMILPFTLAEGAIQVAEEIMMGVRRLQLLHAQSEISQWVTLSLGVATTIPSPDDSPANLIAVADSALYAAKLKGRNQIIFKESILK